MAGPARMDVSKSTEIIQVYSDYENSCYILYQIYFGYIQYTVYNSQPEGWQTCQWPGGPAWDLEPHTVTEPGQSAHRLRLFDSGLNFKYLCNPSAPE